MKVLFLMAFLAVSVAFCPAETSCSLKVLVQNIQHNEGKILVALFHPDNSKAFPEDHKNIYQYKIVDARKGTVTVHFENLKPGKYAYAVLHDFNNNLKTDKNLVGYPTEPYGFSNNVKPLFSAPSFQDCAFDLNTSVEHKVDLIH